MFETRIKSLQNSLSDHEIDALLITSPYNIGYLSGILAFSIEEREARILLTKQKCYLFTDPRYAEMVREQAGFVTLVEIGAGKPFSKRFESILKKEKVKQLGFEEENITYKEAADIEEKIPSVELIPTQDIVEEQRQTKDNDEVSKIKAACALTDKAFAFIIKQIKVGMTELEVKTILENFIRSEGGKLSFDSIVAFGPNSAIPHHMSTNVKLKTSNVVLLDFGARVDGYSSDMTRTIFMGKPTEALEKMYTTTREAQEVGMDYLKTHMKEGFETKRAHELANGHIETMGFAKIPHSLGHGVGLQVHELPWLSPYSEGGLQPGMVVTVEPGIYVPRLGGIRIEDTVLITTQGIEVLTKSSKEVLIIGV